MKDKREKSRNKPLWILLIIVIVALIIWGVVFWKLYNSVETEVDTTNSSKKNSSIDKTEEEENEEEVSESNPIATIEMENGGIIKIELYPDIAPNTVANFISLANSGFYDNLTFHRTIPEFMIQGGDPNGDGTGGADYTIEGEFSSNGVKNSLKHKRGVISMARSDYTSLSSELKTESYNSGGSQFFIMVADANSLDGLYASFGEVIEGMDIVDEIVNTEVITRSYGSEGADRPVEPQIIKTIRVETFGLEYEEPHTLTPFDLNQYLMEYYGI